MTFRRARPWIALAAALVALAFLTGQRDGGDEPLDPRSPGKLGTRGLVLLLRESGADVSITRAVPRSVQPRQTALLLRDQLSRARRRELRRWVELGGTLVVTDPLSEFVPLLERGDPGLFSTNAPDRGGTLRPGCPLAAMSKVRRVDTQAVPFRVPSGATGCFPRGKGAVLVAKSVGAGAIVSWGGAAAFVNERLGKADNAVLAVSLLAPAPGGSVVVLERSEAGGGDDSLFDLVDDRVKRGLWQLAVAFGVFALWRARRLGRPVLEPQPVEIAGSELVSALGRLLDRAHRRDQAAAMLRRHLRRSLADRIGVPADAPVEAMAAAASTAGVAADQVATALSPRVPPGDDELLALAQSVESIRKEVTHAR